MEKTDKLEFSLNVLQLTEDPYVSIQGEGRYVGMPMLFVRIQGCPVGCEWCDSYYTWFPYKQSQIPKDVSIPALHSYNLHKLSDTVIESKALHVWFTGGEPTTQADAIYNFIKYFKERRDDRMFHICTAGWIWNEQLYIELDNITVDIKPPSSKTKSNYNVVDKIYDYYNHKSEFKMVVANTDEDRLFAMETVNKYPNIEWTLQPLYMSEPELLAKEIKVVDIMNWDLSKFADWINSTFRSTSVRLGLQLHKHLYPTKMRGI